MGCLPAGPGAHNAACSLPPTLLPWELHAACCVPISSQQAAAAMLQPVWWALPVVAAACTPGLMSGRPSAGARAAKVGGQGACQREQCVSSSA